MAAIEELGSVLQSEESHIHVSSMSSSSDNETSDSCESNEMVQQRINCACKSQCMRKLKTSANGKVTGCPCRGSSAQCGEMCTCGTKSKPCKNKPQTYGPEQEIEKSTRAPQRQAEGNEQSEVSVEEIIDGLDSEFIIKLVKEGFKSRPLVLKDLVEQLRHDPGHPGSQGEDVEQPNAVPFCRCGYCREMPTDKERVCCKERRLCRSKTLAFQNICLDSDNLATVIRSLADTYVFTPTYDNRAMRHAAYRQYVMWIHGHLGKGNRKVIPSCCVWKVRKHYPSPNGHYTGYKD